MASGEGEGGGGQCQVVRRGPPNGQEGRHPGCCRRVSRDRAHFGFHEMLTPSQKSPIVYKIHVNFFCLRTSLSSTKIETWEVLLAQDLSKASRRMGGSLQAGRGRLRLATLHGCSSRGSKTPLLSCREKREVLPGFSFQRQARNQTGMPLLKSLPTRRVHPLGKGQDRRGPEAVGTVHAQCGDQLNRHRQEPGVHSPGGERGL